MALILTPPNCTQYVALLNDMQLEHAQSMFPSSR
jgi:hypothetical protein